MAYTDFYCDSSTGSNMNGGDGGTLSSSTNGDWDNAVANRFTAASGTPFSGASVGQFASVFLDGATTPVYVAKVTAVNGGGTSVDLSSSLSSGTKPTAGATGRSVNIGGKWLGPNAGVGFPFGFITPSLNDGTNVIPRVNLFGTYSITSGITHSSAGPIVFSGYKTVAGDGLNNPSDATYKATIDGGTSAINLCVISGADIRIEDFIFSNNGTTGTNVGLALNGARVIAARCVAHDIRGNGFSMNASGPVNLVECEAYSCNTSNSANSGGISWIGNAGTLICERCISHDNTGTNNCGFASATTSTRNGVFLDCIADSNGLHGWFISSPAAYHRLENCDAYNNGVSATGDGVRLAPASGTGSVQIENCNLVSNSGYGINRSDSNTYNLLVQTCGFFGNTSGTTTGLSIGDGNGSVTLSASPYSAPTTGNFKITGASAKNAGRGTFCQTQASYTGTVGYPDLGAAQHQDAGGGGGYIWELATQ